MSDKEKIQLKIKLDFFFIYIYEIYISIPLVVEFVFFIKNILSKVGLVLHIIICVLNSNNNFLYP